MVVIRAFHQLLKKSRKLDVIYSFYFYLVLFPSRWIPLFSYMVPLCGSQVASTKWGWGSQVFSWDFRPFQTIAAHSFTKKEHMEISSASLSSRQCPLLPLPT
jgi:hypothetical protein